MMPARTSKASDALRTCCGRIPVATAFVIVSQETGTPTSMTVPMRGTAQPQTVSPAHAGTGRYLWYMTLAAKWSRQKETSVSKVLELKAMPCPSAKKGAAKLCNVLIIKGLIRYLKRAIEGSRRRIWWKVALLALRQKAYGSFQANRRHGRLGFWIRHERFPNESTALVLGHQQGNTGIDSDDVRVIPVRQW